MRIPPLLLVKAPRPSLATSEVIVPPYPPVPGYLNIQHLRLYPRKQKAPSVTPEALLFPSPVPSPTAKNSESASTTAYMPRPGIRISSPSPKLRKGRHADPIHEHMSPKGEVRHPIWSLLRHALSRRRLLDIIAERRR